MFEIIIIVFALLALTYGAYSDIRRREVPDWVNYSFVVIALALRLCYSLVYWDFSYIIDGLLGFGAMFLAALLMFYTGQWGGGDSKFLMGFGALVGLNYTAVMGSDLMMFLINAMLFGAVFVLIWSAILAVLNWKKMKVELEYLRKKHIKLRIFLLIFLIAAAASSFFITSLFVKVMIFGFFSVAAITFYMWIFVKAVEGCCMVKDVPVEKLTEGDWIVNDVRVKGKYITGPKELGISEEQINKLLKLKKEKKISRRFTVTIKEGVPFIPSFLVAYILVLLFDNWLVFFF